MRKFLLAAGLVALVGAPNYSAAEPVTAAATDADDTAAPNSPDILEIMDITDVINDKSAEKVADKVKDINQNKRIRAVLLTVNSPGGGVVASSNINEELSKLRVPVVAWCNSECASGGMYVLMNKSVKFIGVRKETIAGSIGVVMSMTKYNRLMDWARLDNEVYKSAPLKDAGNPGRETTDADRAYFQSIINSLAADFYGIIKDSRGDKITDWDAVKSARIFFGQEAVKVGLVDGVITYEEAERKAKELSGSKAIYTREEMKKMAKVAGDDSGGYLHYSAPELPMNLDGLLSTLHDIQLGETVRFEYLAPYHF
jgi:signal peptide peptidase SppA